MASEAETRITALTVQATQFDADIAALATRAANLEQGKVNASAQITVQENRITAQQAAITALRTEIIALEATDGTAGLAGVKRQLDEIDAEIASVQATLAPLNSDR